MMSIQRRLLLGLLLGLIGLSVASGLVLFFSVRIFLERQLNATLIAKAQAFGHFIRLMPDGQLALEPSQNPQAWNEGAAGAEFYQVWAEDGSTLLRSPDLGQKDLPRGPAADSPGFADGALPGGIPVRIVTFRFVATMEDDDETASSKPQQLNAEQRPVKNVVVVVAQDKSELNRFLKIILWASVLITAFACLGTALVVQVVVRRSLHPLQQVAAQAARIDEQSLHIRFSLDGLPAELQPICLRLNASLQRLQQAFERERRFTADVAHELRTPIAELRVLAEVALRGISDPTTTTVYFQDARDIARQMERVVSTLLALARCHSGTTTIVRESVDLKRLFQEAWQPYQQNAMARRIAFRFEMPTSLVINSDRTMLQSILGNLMSNAAEYTRTGGAVVCKVEEGDSKVRIRIANPVEGLMTADVSQLFEPFWRKDHSRTDGSHCGLGLTLVRAYTQILGGCTSASLSEDNCLHVAVDLPIDGE